jgi:anti-sigma factor RsiW
MSRNDIVCRDVVELITDYLEGALPVKQRVELEQHLVICRGCADHVGQVQATRHVLASLDAHDEVTPEARERLLQTFREWRSR